jgi:integrase
VIFKRGKRWVCKVYVGRVGGKERQQWRTFATRDEAERNEAHLRLDGAPLAPSPLTVREYLEDWVEAHHVREQSRMRYRSVVRHHLVPALGHIRLTKLGPAAIENFIRSELDAGYSPTTIRVNLAVLTTAFNRAVKHRLLTQNPMALVDLPAPGPSAAKHWDTEQVRLFLGTVRRSWFHTRFIVTVATGLRSCEVRALRDEDYDPPFLYVRQKVRRVRGAWVFDDYLKTRAGERVVTLPPFAQSALAESITGKRGLLFRSQYGEPPHTTVVQLELDRVAKEAGILRIRFHDLRHTVGYRACQ